MSEIELRLSAMTSNLDLLMTTAFMVFFFIILVPGIENRQHPLLHCSDAH